MYCMYVTRKPYVIFVGLIYKPNFERELNLHCGKKIVDFGFDWYFFVMYELAYHMLGQPGVTFYLLLHDVYE